MPPSRGTPTDGASHLEGTPSVARYLTIDNAARIVQRHPRSVQNWLGQGWITAFRAEDGTYRVDLDEIEHQFKVNPRMRDGRKPFGDKARIVQLPIEAVSGEAQS